MSKSFTNAHSHIFTVNHVPDYFLRTTIRDTAFARWVQKWIERKGTRRLLSLMHRIIGFFSPNYRDTLKRYIEFIEIGASASQKDIYNQLATNYIKYGSYKIIVLTQVLDYLDIEAQSNHIKITTQIEQVAELKRNALYQDSIFPFLGVDPRMPGINIKNDWVEKYISKDYGFRGIKIYPAYGFFPFDVRLDPVWAWAEKNNVPVMTHCTRGGSFYLGRFESLMNAGAFTVETLNPTSAAMPSIINRINHIIADDTVHKTNMVWCNVFGHPENYIPVLEKYPNLKLCLAHLGGANEILRKNNQPNQAPVYPEYLQDNWYSHVLNILKKYPNTYSDISYTLSNEQALKIIVRDFRNPLLTDEQENCLFKRLLYGTDFYLTQQEPKGDEPDMENLFATYFNDAERLLLAYNNPANYLASAIFPSCKCI